MHKTDYNLHYRADFRLNKLECTQTRSGHYVAVNISYVNATQGSLFTRKHLQKAYPAPDPSTNTQNR